MSSLTTGGETWSVLQNFKSLSKLRPPEPTLPFRCCIKFWICRIKDAWRRCSWHRYKIYDIKKNVLRPSSHAKKHPLSSTKRRGLRLSVPYHGFRHGRSLGHQLNRRRVVRTKTRTHELKFHKINSGTPYMEEKQYMSCQDYGAPMHTVSLITLLNRHCVHLPHQSHQ